MHAYYTEIFGNTENNKWENSYSTKFVVEIS